MVCGDINVSNYWITWFPGALLAVLGIVALCWKGVIAFTRTQAAVQRIEYEFSPNSGKSMRDQVDAVRVEQQTVAKALAVETERRAASDKRMSQHIEDDRRAFTKIDAALDRIEDHLRR